MKSDQLDLVGVPVAHGCHHGVAIGHDCPRCDAEAEEALARIAESTCAHRWKPLGCDRDGNAVSQCLVCGEILEQ